MDSRGLNAPRLLSSKLCSGKLRLYLLIMGSSMSPFEKCVCTICSDLSAVVDGCIGYLDDSGDVRLIIYVT